MKWWVWILMFTWELPQTILGAILLAIFHRGLWRPIMYDPPEHARVWVNDDGNWGVSLGQIIIVPYTVGRIIPHEYGHTIQSLYLGPLYLLLIGLPSITFNILTRLGWVDQHKYYDRPWEAWADRLGGIDRGSL